MSNIEHAQEMTQAEYAKYRGVSRVSVTRWKRKGLLVFTESGKISVTQSDRNLDQGNNLGNSLGNRVTDEPGNKSPSTEPKKEPKPTIPDPEESTYLVNELQKFLDGMEYVSEYKAKEIKENYLALIRKLEYEQKAGKLVEVEPLKKRIFDLFRRERDALLNLPTRISAIIAAELGVDQNKLTILLEKQINEFLHERADQPRIRFS